MCLSEETIEGLRITGIYHKHGFGLCISTNVMQQITTLYTNCQYLQLSHLLKQRSTFYPSLVATSCFSSVNASARIPSRIISGSREPEDGDQTTLLSKSVCRMRTLFMHSADQSQIVYREIAGASWIQIILKLIALRSQNVKDQKSNVFHNYVLHNLNVIILTLVVPRPTL